MEGSAGEVAEWLKALAWKACIRETVSRVRIPPSPPRLHLFQQVTIGSEPPTPASPRRENEISRPSSSIRSQLFEARQLSFEAVAMLLV